MIRIDIKRSNFYSELSKQENETYFSCFQKKYLPNIDNIYYSVKLKDDDVKNEKLEKLFLKLSELKEVASRTHEPQRFETTDLFLDTKSFQIYGYCLTCTDLYDIFIVDKLPNLDTPRIIIQIRSYGIWLYGWKEMVKRSFFDLQNIFEPYDVEIYSCTENRIDYCYHTNAITNPEKIFSDRVVQNSMKTTLTRYHITGRIEKTDKTKLYKDYFALGERKSNYVFIRFYNKGLEVVEQGYKAYFFEIWFRFGLINFYDKFCFEYAYQHKDYNLIHKAKLEFYLLYGKNPELKQKFSEALGNKTLTASDYKALANETMPEVTTVQNIEFETKRKYYYHSDQFIDTLPINGDLPDEALKRLWRVIDNRNIFLDWLTDKSVKFVRQNGGYCDWWERLRNTKLDCLNTNTKLVREYSNRLDHELMKRRFIGTVASNAAYMNKKNSGFIEDLSDLLANINDNDKNNISLNYFNTAGEILNQFESKVAADYGHKRGKCEARIRNRLETNVIQTSTAASVGSA